MTGSNQAQQEPADADRRLFSTELAVALTAALGTTLMLQATRVFLAYLVFEIDQANRGQLAGISFGVFAAFVFGGVLARGIGPRGVLGLTALVLVIARLILQFTELPDWRMWLGATVVIAWGWMLPSLRSLRPTGAARGVVFGLLLDLTIRFLMGTVDLPWMPSLTAHFITIALVLIFVLFASWVLTVAGPSVSAGAGPSLLAVGPALVTFHLVTGNLGIADVEGGFPIQVMVWLFAIGIAAGFSMQIALPVTEGGRKPPSQIAVAVFMTAIGGLGVFMLFRWNGFGDLGATLFAAVTTQLLLLGVRGRDGARPKQALVADGGWLTLGMLIHAAIIFVYYSATGMPLLIGVALVVLALGAVFVAPRGQPMPVTTGGRYVAVLVGVAAVLLLLGVFVNRPYWSGVERTNAVGPAVTAMTYNIQAGFSRENIWSLEETARTIEAQAPDVVLLQEVSRGWLILGGVDQARWLADRLDMNLAWGPSAEDGLWGVATLTKGEILGIDFRMYDSTQNLQRGVLGVVVETTTGELWVYNTHLDDPSGAGAVRLEQVTQLLAAAEGASPAIIGGDFNALPDSDVIDVVLAAGFSDTGAAFPTAGGTFEDGEHIDYLFMRGPISASEGFVVQEWSSDHRPVVARLAVE